MISRVALDEEQWLATTAINELVRVLPWRYTIILHDSSFMYPDDFYPLLPNQIDRQEAKIASDEMDVLNLSVKRPWISQRKRAFRVKDHPAQANPNDCGGTVIVYAIYQILDLPLPFSIDFALWRRVSHAVLTDRLPGSKASLDTSTVPAQAASPSFKQDAVQFVDTVPLLRAELGSSKKILKQARRKHSIAIDVADTINAVLPKVQIFFNTSTEQRDMYRTVIDDCSRSLNTF
ncbi:MAG: hypothetical protein L6R36_006816 [Xanthoria steineri]|nr:MAG: hypothetical protein L6R36_006816 [Xanthoria steineri]